MCPSETVIVDCPKCKGTGGTYSACKQCLGFGRVRVPFANRYDMDAQSEDQWRLWNEGVEDIQR